MGVTRRLKRGIVFTTEERQGLISLISLQKGIPAFCQLVYREKEENKAVIQAPEGAFDEALIVTREERLPSRRRQKL